MAALGLSLALFAYWTIVGQALLGTLHTRRNSLRSLLLAPAFGIAVTIWPVFLLNRAGLPVAAFGPLLAALLVLASAVFLWRSRPVLPWRQYAPFAAVFVVALVLTGRPMLDFGFNWLSYANDDMANYVLGAQFFLDNAFPNVPDVSYLVNGSDYSLYYWFFYIPHAVRPGSELLLALIVSVTRLTGHQAFMPLILSLHLALISTAAALVLRTRAYRLAALLTAALLAASALTAFATLAQLIGQVIGLTLVGACACLLMGPWSTLHGWAPLRTGALVGLLGSALLIVYPEVMPFLGLAFIVYTTVQLVRRRAAPTRAMLRLVGAAVVTGLVLVNAYAIDVVLFMSIQLTGGLRPSASRGFIFPYFLLPSGLADFWGLQTIDRMAGEPWRSIGIFLGAALLVVAIACSIVLTWRGHAGPTLAAVMLGFGALLFLRSNDFGLFKIALFAQPFVLGALAIGLVRPNRWLRWQTVPLVVVIAGGLAGQLNYVERSRDRFNEIPNGSQSDINTEFQHAIGAFKPREIVIDTINISLAKFQALYTRGIDTNFPSRDFFSYIIGRDLRDVVIVPGQYDNARTARDAVDSRFTAAFFALHDPNDPDATDEFRINTLGQTSLQQTCDAFVATTATQSVFNRRSARPTDTTNFSVTPCADVHNHLIFVHSKLGQHYYQTDLHYFGEDTPTIGIYPLESDPLYVGQTMAGLGRYLLLEVVGPSPRVRLALDVTATLKADGDNRLPPAAAIGDRREPFPTEGRGAARVFSAPLTPQVVDGHSYVAIDMGVDARRFPEERSALMALYNLDVPFDRRELVGFGRDVSLVSDDDYARLAPPSVIRQFPSDLANPNLEFSGIYEDGWLSEAAFFELTQPATATSLSVRGMLPLVDDQTFTSDLEVLVDGQPVASRVLKPGAFQVDAPVSTPAGKHRVDLRFSRLQRLSAPDKRPAAALLQAVGFIPVEAGAPQLTDVVAGGSGLAVTGDGWYPLETFEGETFRWVSNDAVIAVPASSAADRRLKLDLAAGPGVGGERFQLQILDGDGRAISEVPVEGRQTVIVPIPSATLGPTMVRLHVEGGGQATPDDPRMLNFRVFAVDWASGP